MDKSRRPASLQPLALADVKGLPKRGLTQRKRVLGEAGTERFGEAKEQQGASQAKKTLVLVRGHQERSLFRGGEPYPPASATTF